MPYYAKDTGSGQSLIIDDQTGATIAVCYNPAHAPILAHRFNVFEAMTSALEQCQAVLGDHVRGYDNPDEEPSAEAEAYNSAKEALQEATAPVI